MKPKKRQKNLNRRITSYFESIKRNGLAYEKSVTKPGSLKK